MRRRPTARNVAQHLNIHPLSDQRQRTPVDATAAVKFRGHGLKPKVGLRVASLLKEEDGHRSS